MVLGIWHLFGFLRHDAVLCTKHNSRFPGDPWHSHATVAERIYRRHFIMVCPFQYIGFARGKAQGSLCTQLANNRIHVTRPRNRHVEYDLLLSGLQ